MAKKVTVAALPSSEWNAGLKEPWHIDFDKEPVNDDKWSCVVTAAVQAEAQDEKCIQTYAQMVDTGASKVVKIISMNDVVKLLRETGKQEKSQKKEKNVKTSDSPIPQIVELAAKYAIFSETECTLPPDLMAALLKHMILNLKQENYLAKRIAAVRERKIRERNIRAKFIRSLKPYEMIHEEKKSSGIDNANTSEQKKPADDEFGFNIVGPDLYILLVDFYNVFIFPELLKINVPFLAILKIADDESLNLKNKPSILSTKSEGVERKRFAVNSFWETLKMDGLDSRMFKNIIVLEYKYKQTESKFSKYIFDELTWTQYSVYHIFRQYQHYLQELKVQRLIQSLETLDLSKCEVYNKLCDALITGEPLTPLLVLYAIVEQVVAGVPETESMVLEYEPQFTDFFPSGSDSITTTDDSTVFKSSIATSCKCRQKHEKDCENLKKNFSNHSLSEKNERTEPSEHNSVLLLRAENSSKKLSPTVSTESSISESLIDEVMKEKKTEKEMRNEKRWKTPSLCFYGDLVFLQTYYCDTRILDPKAIVKRFLEKLQLPQIWKNYPELLPGEKAFYNFHFFNFMKNSKECEEKLIIKIFFMCISLNLISIKNSILFVREEEKTFDILSPSFQERVTFLPDIFKLDKRQSKEDEKEGQNFQDFFMKTFNRQPNSFRRKEKYLSTKSEEKLRVPDLKKTKSHLFLNFQYSSKSKSQFAVTAPTKKSEMSYSEAVKNLDVSDVSKTIQERLNQQSEKLQTVPLSLVNCSEISNLTKHNLFSKTNLDVIEDYKFYEKLSPSLMIQRLIEAEENFNTVQCSHFPLVDALIIIMHNDCDHRGIYFFTKKGALLTPVSFKDFHSYVFLNIKNWVILKNDEFLKFLSEVKEKKKAEEEKKDTKYLTQLKKEYCEMSEENRKEFLETDVDFRTEPEVSENELGDLPVKPKPPNLKKISFVATNYSDLRVEANQETCEFYSSDGTEVHSSVETWLYAASGLHKLLIKKSKMELYYNHWLNEQTKFSFTLKTSSNIILSFYKDGVEKMNNFNYYLTISWPTGLLIKPVFQDSNTYVKQSYLKTYRKGWDIEDERSRCFLENGQVLIFRENGNCDILCGSGTKYTFKDSETKHEIISTTGEIWEVRRNNRCRNKKEFIGCNKVFVGVDSKTQETFCRREDGVFLMLWQNGTLVTNYPDGTKITSTPYFEEKEVIIEWTDEEKLYFEDIYRSEISVQEPRSRTILRNVSVPKFVDKKISPDEGFISVACEYVMEHPKYSTVYFNKDPYIKMRMPEQLCVSIHPNGNYEIQQEKDFLKVNENGVRFYTECDNCRDRSIVTLDFGSNEILCRCSDFFKKGFLVFRSGRIMFKKFYEEPPDDQSSEKKEHELKKTPEKSNSKINICEVGHDKKMASMQRCFILYRDLNGLEFIHEDTFKDFCYGLPEETYFDIDTNDPLSTSYTFSSPNYKIGHEKWVMDYENVDNSLPTSIKKKDLKELGTKDTPKKLFKYLFPRESVDSRQNETPKRIIKMPKLIIGRTIWYLCDEPSSVISQMQNYVEKYRKRVENLCSKYESQTTAKNSSEEYSYVEMRLRKIALTLNQSFKMYPHLGTQLPSTETEIHHFGHFIKCMDGMKNRLQDDSDILPDCKQIPKPLPRLSDLPDIYEETETD